jgi:hypothetical protein
MAEEWPASVLEAKFGQPPGSSNNWNAETFDIYWRLHVAENREHWPPDAEEARLSHPRPQATTLLDHEQAFWQRFVVNGQLDHGKLSEAGYEPPQAVWIEGEMRDLGWL